MITNNFGLFKIITGRDVRDSLRLRLGALPMNGSSAVGFSAKSRGAMRSREGGEAAEEPSLLLSPADA